MRSAVMMVLRQQEDLMVGEVETLKHVCQSLEKIDVPYMLTGSFAANFYAVPRMTRDIDIVVEILSPDIDKFCRTFQDVYYLDQRALSEAVQNEGMFNIVHNGTVIKVDFILCKDTPYRREEFRRKRQVQLDDIKIWIVSPEDLVISKLFWAQDSLSERQLSDVKNILATSLELDEDYMQKWMHNLGLISVYERVK